MDKKNSSLRNRLPVFCVALNFIHSFSLKVKRKYKLQVFLFACLLFAIAVNKNIENFMTQETELVWRNIKI
jgi:hypothetical protein